MPEHIESGFLVVVSLVALLLHGLGILSTISALATARTSQGAIAWAMSLITFPYVALPLYWIFGRSKFRGYVDARRRGNLDLAPIVRVLQQHRVRFQATLEGDLARLQVLETLARMPFTAPNDVRLLVDGDATFGAIFEAIDSAQKYILVEFFIIHDDLLGRELQVRLIRKAREGVRVHVLYDEIGSHGLPREYIDELRVAGVDIRAFGTTRGWRNRWQLNFRNHRKIVVIDGRIGFVGGLNVGDEYMGRSRKFGHWRDTHARFEGPCVTCVQLAFVEDWNWAARDVPQLDWEPVPAAGASRKVLVLPSSPADELETCNLYFLHAIHQARRRLWIVSPYFVPEADVLHALQLAALRGVDVRVLLPQKPDHLFVYLASFSCISQLRLPNLRFYRYEPGFLHQKVILVDDDMASVGTANADNRSFRLNFEITMVVADREFAASVEKMLEADFARSRLASEEDHPRRGLVFQLGVKISRLLSPILCLLLALFLGVPSHAEDAPRPNVVFILADDLGWKDLGCYGSTFHETPRLDRLAAEGMRFTDAYAACPVCSPTRASILTGKYPPRVGITDWIPGDDPRDRQLLGPADLHALPLAEVTIAEVLREAGYRTLLAGKWHLGGEGFLPEDQGFDVNRGGHAAGSPPGGYYSPYKNPKLPDGPEGEYLTDRLTDESIRFMREHTERFANRPFFVYLAFHTVHTPIQACRRHLAKFEAKARALPPSDGESFVAERGAWTKQRQDLVDYATMVHAMDENVGRLLDSLDGLGISRSTLVFFTSDNGGLSTLGRKGAPTSNLPLRAGKGWCYEGGIRVPLIIRAPGVTAAGSVSAVPVTSTDFYPTILELTGTGMRSERRLDGQSLVPVLKGAASLSRPAIFWHYPHYHTSGWKPGAAVRAGDWKLIEFCEEGKLELYDLREDPGERNDLSAKRPEKRDELLGLLRAWQTEVGARPALPR